MTNQERKLRAVEMYGEGKSRGEIADALGVSVRTVSRLLGDREIRDSLTAIADQRLAEVGELAANSARTGVTTLVEICEDQEAPPTARVSAGKALVDLALRLAETVALARRVADLEARAAELGD